MMDVITAGFALFAMLFGAGNLIFPPMLGYELGNSWGIASFAFILTGVGIPLMGIIASAISCRIYNFNLEICLFRNLFLISIVIFIEIIKSC